MIFPNGKSAVKKTKNVEYVNRVEISVYPYTGLS